MQNCLQRKACVLPVELELLDLINGDPGNNKNEKRGEYSDDGYSSGYVNPNRMRESEVYRRNIFGRPK